MLDITNIVTNSEYYKVFYNNGTGGTNGINGTLAGNPASGSWQTWQKPRGKCDFIWMMCIGGGAGGGGGAISSSVAGSGGASAAVTTALFPAHVLPDTLYVWVGKGGPGGSGGVGFGTPAQAGKTGGKSLVAIRPLTSGSSIYNSTGNMDLVCSNGQVVWNTPTAGENGNDSTTRMPKLISLGVWDSVDGRSQAAGNVTPLTGPTITCPGADGGANLATGSSILSVNLGTFPTPFISGGLAGGNNNGQSGIWSWKPMYGTGGAGGGSYSGTPWNGGNGGKGAFGCGGGGGGVFNPGNGGVGGNGGDGGDGLVIIATF
jgi:hypothetical protein